MIGIRAPAAALLVAGLASGCGPGAGGGPVGASALPEQSIGRMKVSIMPEYDDASVLVVYEGRFEDAPRYPIRTSFFVPSGSVISDACSLSHEGRHFCQLYQTVRRGSYDEVLTQLPYPSYYLSFHTPRLDLRNELKEIDYRIRASHGVKSLEVEVQQPLRSTAFSVTAPRKAVASAPAASLDLVKGFQYVAYRLEGVAKDEENAFLIRYRRSDPNPSVDIKYASMRGTSSQEAPYETQRNIRTILYVLLATGALGVMALAAWMLRSRGAKRDGGSR